MGAIIDKPKAIETKDNVTHGLDNKDIEVQIDELPVNSRGEHLKNVRDSGDDTNRKINHPKKCMILTIIILSLRSHITALMNYVGHRVYNNITLNFLQGLEKFKSFSSNPEVK